MVSGNFTIANPYGFHVRPTKTFVDKATTFPNCEIQLLVGTKKVNAKSSLGVMALGLKQNSEVTLQVTGEQEEQAFKELGELLTKIFD